MVNKKTSISIIVILLAGWGLVRAADYTSTNFTLRDPIVSIFGGESTSTSFSAVQSGGQAGTGLATSTSFELRGGFAYFNEFTGQTQNWRWYDDEDAVTPTSSLAAENTAPGSAYNENEIKLRITVKELAGIAGSNVKFRLQYSTSSDFSTGSVNVAATSSCSATSRWCYGEGAGADNGTITSSTLSDADACTGGSGNGCGTHNETPTSTATFDHPKNAATEYEFTIKPSGAEQNTTYFFRLYHMNSTSSVPRAEGGSYPSIQVAGAELTFTIGGLGSGVTTEGITTDVTTTATAIPFGTLNVDTDTEAAQRMTVTTSATNGYQIFAFGRQELIRSGGAAIDGVSGTNASPSAWSTGCAASAAGCYGYHAGDDSLADSSTRFAANDTYAAFTTSSAEVAYDSAPVTTSTVDMVYKVKAGNTQEAGDYTSSVVYIIVPTF